MKTIGVLGGFGPQATMDFEVRLHRVSQALIPRRGNRGYPPAIVIYHRHAPFILGENGIPTVPLTLDPRLLESAKRLGGMADFLVITGNAPHLYQKEIEEAAGRPVLSMIATTVDEVESRKWRRVGVLGLGKPLVYTNPLEKRGTTTILVDEDVRARIDKEIFRVMEGSNDQNSRETALGAIETLRSEKVDGIILGGTEIPVMLGADAEAEGLLNPLQLLAEAAVQFAIE